MRTPYVPMGLALPLSTLPSFRSLFLELEGPQSSSGPNFIRFTEKSRRVTCQGCTERQGQTWDEEGSPLSPPPVSAILICLSNP